MDQQYITQILTHLQIDQALIDAIANQVDDAVIDDWHHHLYYDTQTELKLQAKVNNSHIIYRQIATIQKDDIYEINHKECECIANLEHFVTIIKDNNDTLATMCASQLQITALF